MNGGHIIMNREEWKELDPEEQQITIAELCGYCDFQGGWSCNSPLKGRILEGNDIIIRFVPNYLNDLNVMNKVIMSLSIEDRCKWIRNLQRIARTRDKSMPMYIDDVEVALSTAKQRAEAFILVMTENKEI